MANPELVNYIREHVKQGLPLADIKTALRKSGWSEEAIFEGVREAGVPVSRDEEVREIKRILAGLNERVAVLERTDLSAATSAPVEVHTSVATVSSPVAVSPAKAEVKKDSVESQVTGRWFAAIGIIALLFGLGFFLKYAFDNNLIGPMQRVVLGITAGVVFLIGGNLLWLKEKYRQYSYFISGGGLAFLYLSFFAAYNFYHFISAATAFAFMVLVTAIGVTMALRLNSRHLATLALVGGFLSPFLALTGHDNQLSLFTYLMVLNAGFLVVRYFRRWSELHSIAFLGTFASVAWWIASFYSAAELGSTLGFIGVFYLMFLFAPILPALVGRQEFEDGDLIVGMMNAAAYFGLGYILLQADYAAATGLFFILWAAFHVIAAAFAFQAATRAPKVVYSLAGIGIVLLTAAVPIELGQEWVTIAWAVEGGLLASFGVLLKSKQIRFFSIFILGLMVLRMLALDLDIRGPILEVLPILNIRFATLLVAAAALFLSAALYSRKDLELEEGERWIGQIFGLAGNLVLVLALSLESNLYFERRIQTSYLADYSANGAVRSLRNLQNLSLSVIWGVYAALLMLIGIARRSKPLRLLALIGLGLVIVKVFLYDASALSDLYRILSFVTLGVILLVISFLFYKYKERIREMILD